MFFVLAKVLWFLLQPSSLLIGAVVAGALLGPTRWCRLGRRLVWGGAAALLICGLTPLGDVLIRPLEARFPRADIDPPANSSPRPIAGIIVLQHPVLTALAIPVTVVVYLGVVSLVMGVIGLIGGFSGGGIGSFLLGIVSILIGLLLLGAPMATALAVPFVFGILLLIEGVALIIFAFRVKG